ncbi:MAG: alanine dehydrogenase, partial [Saprospiraceae bacterium]|nr:alanine dehydrogenase [Saprospiraceae bacterium]
VDWLIPEKNYLFFSHTIKKQPYNRPLLLAALSRKIRLMDYEVLTNENGERLVAFGYYAGVVGAHNALWTWGKRSGDFELPRMCETHDYAEILQAYQQTPLPPLRIVLTGSGRVASGAAKNLLDMGIRQVSPESFLTQVFTTPVFTQIHAEQYALPRDPNHVFDKKDYYQHGENYVSAFAPYYRRADIFINGIFYDKKAPAFFTVEEMQLPDFHIKVVADVTCDIMPGASVPCTIRPSKIADPVFGFDPKTGLETAPYLPGSVDVMAIDNLPSELPRDASVFFGDQLIKNIFPELILGFQSAVLRRATIAEKGVLTPDFEYLQDYVAGK